MNTLVPSLALAAAAAVCPDAPAPNVYLSGGTLQVTADSGHRDVLSVGMLNGDFLIGRVGADILDGVGVPAQVDVLLAGPGPDRCRAEPIDLTAGCETAGTRHPTTRPTRATAGEDR